MLPHLNHLISEFRGGFEVELRRSLLHCLLESLVEFLEFGTAHGFGILLELLLIGGNLLRNADEVADGFFDRGRCDAVLFVVLHLDFTAAPCLVDSCPHRIGDGIGIHNDMAFTVPGRTADGLNQRSLASKEAFLVRIENRHQTDFRNVESLS